MNIYLFRWKARISSPGVISDGQWRYGWTRVAAKDEHAAYDEAQLQATSALRQSGIQFHEVIVLEVEKL